MNRIIAILSALMLTLLCGQANAQKSKTDNDYNLQRAWEALREENDEAKAFDLVNRQLKETPDNVQALLLRTRLNRKKGEYGAALSDVNRALKVNKPKKSEIAMSTLHWWRGHLYQDMGETQKSSEALGKAYALARKDNKENLQGISFDYGCSLALLERYDEADAVFDAMLEEDETDSAAMVGKASTLIERGRDREAVDILDRARKYSENYSEIYRFQMKAYRNLGEYNKAIDATVSYYDKDDERYKEELASGDAVEVLEVASFERLNVSAWRLMREVRTNNVAELVRKVKELEDIQSDVDSEVRKTFEYTAHDGGLEPFEEIALSAIMIKNTNNLAAKFFNKDSWQIKDEEVIAFVEQHKDMLEAIMTSYLKQQLEVYTYSGFRKYVLEHTQPGTYEEIEGMVRTSHQKRIDGYVAQLQELGYDKDGNPIEKEAQ